MRTSEKGKGFITKHEGVVLRAYRDVVGVWTIGVGHTANAGGIKPEAGMRITHDQALDILARDLRKFERRVDATKAFQAQPAYDGAVSFDFNTGAIHRATWVKRYSENRLSDAHESIMAWTKAGGRRIKGLVNRRTAERNLIFKGDYGYGVRGEGVPRVEQPAPSVKPDMTVKEAQELLTARGFNPGAIDGWMGRNTKAALAEYQTAHPHLTNDGILGPASLAQLRRDALAAKDAIQKGGGSVASTGVTAWAAGLPWGWIVGGVAVAAVLWFGWTYRDVIQRRLNTLIRREVA